MKVIFIAIKVSQFRSWDDEDHWFHDYLTVLNVYLKPRLRLPFFISTVFESLLNCMIVCNSTKFSLHVESWTIKVIQYLLGRQPCIAAVTKTQLPNLPFSIFFFRIGNDWLAPIFGTDPKQMVVVDFISFLRLCS